MIEKHLFIVFGMEHYNPLGLIRTLGKNNIMPVFIAVVGKGHASIRSRYIQKTHLVNTIQDGYELLIKEYGNLEEKPFVLATDDDIQSLLDENYLYLKERFILFNAGKAGRVTQFMDKEEILLYAAKHGMNILPTLVVNHGVVPEGISYPIITKSISPNVGGWKKDVHICYSADELREAYKGILSPKVVIQRFIDKKNECCLEGFSINEGRDIFMPMAVRYNYLLPGYYSPFMTAYAFEDTLLQRQIEELMADIGFEGLFDVEFLIDQDGTYYFSEINFRNSIWNYIGTFLGMPYPILWAKGMLSGKIEENWKKTIPIPYTAMAEPIDYGIRVKKNKMDLADWLSEFKKTDVLFYYDSEDLEPFREMVGKWEVYS